MGEGGDRGDVVDGDYSDLGCVTCKEDTQVAAPDAAEAVDADLYGRVCRFLSPEVRRSGGSRGIEGNGES
jgi:hypothetical protein